MRYLLDTDHCSYLQRGHPEVVRRLQSLPRDAEVVTSVITQAELLAGIEQAPSVRRREELRTLYEQLLTRIADILPVTSEGNRSAYENRSHAAACDFWPPSGSRDGAGSPRSAASCAAVR
jgi:predicted nucleic acid-binding protein